VAAGQPRRLIGARALAAGVLWPWPPSVTLPCPCRRWWTCGRSLPRPLSSNRARTPRCSFTVTNLGILTDTIGCVEVSIPGSFELKEVKLVKLPSGKHMENGFERRFGVLAGCRIPSRARQRCTRGWADRRVQGQGQAATAGAFTWTARAWSSRSCDSGEFLPVPLAIVVGPGPDSDANADPTPTPTPVPSPTPTTTPSAESQPDANPETDSHADPSRSCSRCRRPARTPSRRRRRDRRRTPSPGATPSPRHPRARSTRDVPSPTPSSTEGPAPGRG
jgi:hypothetical protein